MKIDKLPITLTEVFDNRDYREMLIVLVGYGKHGMIYKPVDEKIERYMNRLFDLKLVHQIASQTETIIYCSAICIRAMLDRKLIKLEDIPPYERGDYK